MLSGEFWQFFGLLLSICCWSYASELAVRYAIAVSDNSGLNLSEQRVRWRKVVQRMLAAFFLVFPFLVVIIELVRLMFVATFILPFERFLYLGGSLAIVAMLFSMVIYLYFFKFGTYGPNRPQKTFLGKRSLPAKEQSWLNKLYGIYNDYTFTFPKPSGFKIEFREHYNDFVAELLKNTSDGLKSMPQDAKVLTKGKMVPQEFQLINSQSVETQTSYVYKWVYRIPISFYKAFHNQVRWLFYVSMLVLVLVALLPANSFFFTKFGAPALICLAFACYTGIYAGLLYLDKAVLKNWKFFSLRMLLLVVLLGFSFINEDHPARVSTGKSVERKTVSENFRKWFASYKEKYDETDRPKNGCYPVFFICAEGGALRTGAYTGVFLSKLEQVLADTSKSIDFRSSVYGMSGVSGGAVGLGYYNAVAFNDGQSIEKDSVEKAKKFFTQDSLSPLIGKMLFGDFINLFLPFCVERFDRAIALEETWEHAYKEVFKDRKNFYQSNFLENANKVQPTFIINTTEVETGLQCVLSNHEMSGMKLSLQRDLLKKRISTMSYSTAINFSTRFPLFSPAATVFADTIYRLKGNRSHFVDGGYVENTGSASMLELLQEIKKDKKLSEQVVPVVITLLFAPDEQSEERGVRWLNELSEIGYALYNVRGGTTKTSRLELREYVEHWGGLAIDAPFRSKNVPMNWVLSERSFKEVEVNVKNMLHPNEDIMKRLRRKDLEYLTFKQKISR